MSENLSKPQAQEPLLYICPICGLHYLDAETAKECEAWCSVHTSCNLAVARLSQEARQAL